MNTIKVKGLEPGSRLFRNAYICPDCEAHWEDIWDSGCDDECPNCGARDISPALSVELTEVAG